VKFLGKLSLIYPEKSLSDKSVVGLYLLLIVQLDDQR